MEITKHFIESLWQFQNFNILNEVLNLENGMEIKIFNPGRLNPNKIPDFLDAKIRFDGIIWNGNIQLYLKTSDLIKNTNTKDRLDNYVLLYVVWENDITDNKNPILSLKEMVSKSVLEQQVEIVNVWKKFKTAMYAKYTNSN
jgi:hypothetical protein